MKGALLLLAQMAFGIAALGLVAAAAVIAAAGALEDRREARNRRRG